MQLTPRTLATLYARCLSPRQAESASNLSVPAVTRSGRVWFAPTLVANNSAEIVAFLRMMPTDMHASISPGGQPWTALITHPDSYFHRWSEESAHRLLTLGLAAKWLYVAQQLDPHDGHPITDLAYVALDFDRMERDNKRRIYRLSRQRALKKQQEVRRRMIRRREQEE